VVSDISDQYLDFLRRRFAGNSRINVVRYALEEGAREDLYRLRLDTIICLNVLEHVLDDATALRGLAGLLVPGGRLILLVPAHQSLYSSLDRHLDHHRRYGRKALVGLLRESGFVVERAGYFNMLGALGWWFNGRVLRRKILPGAQLRFFNLMTPLVRMEQWVRPPFGLSLILLARCGAVTETATERAPSAELRVSPEEG